MAKWGVPNFEAELDALQEAYDQLLKEHKELKSTVTCDYYESYLREKKRREYLEAKYEPEETGKLSTVEGWEYYDA
jgi:predicted lipid-binding transport protein (Tim44 family)